MSGNVGVAAKGARLPQTASYFCRPCLFSLIAVLPHVKNNRRRFRLLAAIWASRLRAITPATNHQFGMKGIVQSFRPSQGGTVQRAPQCVEFIP